MRHVNISAPIPVIELSKQKRSPIVDGKQFYIAPVRISISLSFLKTCWNVTHPFLGYHEKPLKRPSSELGRKLHHSKWLQNYRLKEAGFYSLKCRVQFKALSKVLPCKVRIPRMSSRLAEKRYPSCDINIIHLSTLSDRNRADRMTVRRQNIRHRSRLRLVECGLRLGLVFRRRACGVASADIRSSVA